MRGKEQRAGGAGCAGGAGGLVGDSGGDWTEGMLWEKNDLRSVQNESGRGRFTQQSPVQLLVQFHYSFTGFPSLICSSVFSQIYSIKCPILK